MVKYYKHLFFSLKFSLTAVCKLTQVNDSVTLQKNISEVHRDAKFDVENITEHNIIQSKKLGNCGMIASMASLANNRELINKVIPTDQNFKKFCNSDIRKPSEFSFNLYKYGKPQLVVVNESLIFWNNSVNSNKLYYSDGLNNNFVGPLLEKALVQLLFKGNYELTHYIDSVKVFSSFSNNFCKEFYETNLSDLGYKLKDVLTHGKNTNSLMVIGFKNNLSQYNVYNCHEYTLIDYTEDIVKLYNPYGKYTMIPRNIVIENFDRLIILYKDNEIFGIPKLNTFVKFTDSWKEVNLDKGISYVDYDLIVEQDDTEVLVNILKKDYKDIVRLIHIIPINNNVISNEEKEMSKLKSKGYIKSSLRAVLRKGKYKLRLEQTLYDHNISGRHQKYSDYSENDKNDFFLQFAASKHCVVKKSDETKKYINETFNWFIEFILDL